MPNVLVALLVLVPAFATGLGLTWLSGLRLGPRGAPGGGCRWVPSSWGCGGGCWDGCSASTSPRSRSPCSRWVRRCRAGGGPAARPVCGPRPPTCGAGCACRCGTRPAWCPWWSCWRWRGRSRCGSCRWPGSPPPTRRLAAGHLSTWSDGSAHLAYAGRFSGGGVVPIDSPIAAGEPARYHLLADFFAAQVGTARRGPAVCPGDHHRLPRPGRAHGALRVRGPPGGRAGGGRAGHRAVLRRGRDGGGAPGPRCG